MINTNFTYSTRNMNARVKLEITCINRTHMYVHAAQVLVNYFMSSWHSSSLFLASMISTSSSYGVVVGGLNVTTQVDGYQGLFVVVVAGYQKCGLSVVGG